MEPGAFLLLLFSLACFYLIPVGFFPFHKDVKSIHIPGAALGEEPQAAAPLKSLHPSPGLALCIPWWQGSRGTRGHFSSRRKALWTQGSGKSELGLFVNCYKAFWIASWTRVRPVSAATGLVVCTASPGTDVLMAAPKAPPITCHSQDVWFATLVTITKTADILPDCQFAISDKA